MVTLAFVAFAVAPISLMVISGRISALGGVRQCWAVIAALILLRSLPFLVDVEFAGMLVFLALLVWTPQLSAFAARPDADDLQGSHEPRSCQSLDS